MYTRAIRHLVSKLQLKNNPRLLSISILAGAVLVAGVLLFGHSVSQQKVASLQPEKIGMGSGVAACYSSTGVSCSGTNIYYSASWDYSGNQSDVPNCTTAGDSSIHFGVKDSGGNWVSTPQNLGCADSGSISFGGSNNTTYYGVVVGAQSNQEFHRAAFVSPACNAAPPPQPAAIWASCDNAGGATIAWNTASGASDYYPRVYTPDGNCSSGWILAGDGHTCYKNSTGGANTAYIGNILPNISYSIWVHSGQPYNPNSPTSSSFSCGVSGSLSVTGCTVAPGNSTCAIAYSWTSSNTPNGVNVTFTPPGGGEATINSGTASPGSSSINWGPGLVTFKLYDARSNTLLDTRQTTVGGGSSASGWLSAASCTIPAGQSTCNVILSWGAANALQYVLQGAGGVYGGVQNILLPAPASSPGYAQNLGPGDYLFGIAGWNGSVWQYLANANASVSCATGTSWDGSKCATVTYPSAPSTVNYTCNAAGDRVVISWPDVSGATTYSPRIWDPAGSCSGAAWKLFTDGHTCYQNSIPKGNICGGGNCSFTYPVTPGKTYSSWIHSGEPTNWYAYKGTGNFSCSAPTPPSGPTSLTATCNTPTQVFLSWPKVSGAGKYYLRVWDPAGTCPGSDWTLESDGHTCSLNGLLPQYHCTYNGGTTCVVSYPVTSNTTYSSWVHSGDPVDWNVSANSGNFSCSTNKTPTGFFDAASCDYLEGWMVDPDSTAQLGYVHIYADKGAANERDLGKWQTNQFKDITEANTGIAGLVAGNHGFKVTTPGNIKDGVNHKISIYSVDNETNGEYQLQQSPRYLTCGGTPICNPACGANAACTGTNICSCVPPYVNVGGGVCKKPPSITNFIVSPTRVRPGSSTKISWSSVGADSCTVAGQNKPLGQYVSNGPTSGTLVDSGPLTSETDFTLTCTNSAGSVSLTQTVFLLPVIIDR